MFNLGIVIGAIIAFGVYQFFKNYKIVKREDQSKDYQLNYRKGIAR